MNSINSNLKKIRLLKGYSRKQVAEQLFISEKQYANIENGKSRVDVDRLLVLSHFYCISIQAIVDFNESQLFIAS